MTNSIGMESGILAIYQEEKQVIGKELYKILMGHTAQTPLLLLLKTGITIMPFRDNSLIHLISYVKLEVSLNYRLSDKWTKVVKMQVLV
jgi:hypothetical protein